MRNVTTLVETEMLESPPLYPVRQEAKIQHKEPLQLDLFIPHEYGFAKNNKRLSAAKAVAGRGSQEGIFGELKSQNHGLCTEPHLVWQSTCYQRCSPTWELQMITRAPARSTRRKRPALWEFEQDTLRRRMINVQAADPKASCMAANEATENEMLQILGEALSAIHHNARVNSGFTPLDARKLLADSYYDLGLAYASRGSQERAELLSKHHEIYHELLEEYPESTDVLLNFSRVSEDVPLAESVRLRITRAYAETNYIAGGLLRALADEKSQALGLERLREAFRTASGIEKVNYGRKLVSELRTDGLESEAARTENELSAYRSEHGL